jgi:hypothetical protein
MKNHLFVILTIVLFISCDNDEINRTDEENRILELAYNIDYLYPEGFYQELIYEGSAYYENTVSIKPISEREHIWIELCTNDKNEALLWSNNSNEYSSVNREIISERETDKYFEFKRQNVEYENDILLSRIHKTSYFQPKLDKFKEPDTIGIYNGELSKNSVNELVEYLWSCGSIGLGHSKVIESQIKEFNSYYEQYIQSIKIVYGDWGISDYIYVYDNYFKMNKPDSTLILETIKIITIKGRDN